MAIPILENVEMGEAEILATLINYDQRIHACLHKLAKAPTVLEAKIALKAANNIRAEKARFVSMTKAA